MGGPRVTSGEESKQDYATPDELLVKGIVPRFGQISFDLAAHAGNKKHARYFAPTRFTEKIYLQHYPWNLADDEAYGPLAGRDGVQISFVKHDKKKGYLYEKVTRNDDPEAYAKDAFAQDWAHISKTFGAEHPSGRALLWLNCEFNDVDMWASRCWLEAQRGANITLLSPMTTANWFRDNIAKKADAYMLSGRLCFDGKNVFPKDCLISHFHPEATGKICLWDWKANTLCSEWACRAI